MDEAPLGFPFLLLRFLNSWRSALHDKNDEAELGLRSFLIRGKVAMRVLKRSVAHWKQRKVELSLTRLRASTDLHLSQPVSPVRPLRVARRYIDMRRVEQDV